MNRFSCLWDSTDTCSQLRGVRAKLHALASRASHDAQEMATFTDIGMMFVPSEAGVSHAETEYTSPEQCSQGANVLLRALLEWDRFGVSSACGD